MVGADLAGSVNHCSFCSSLLQNDLTLLKAVAKLSLTSLEGGLLKTAALEVSGTQILTNVLITYKDLASLRGVNLLQH